MAITTAGDIITSSLKKLLVLGKQDILADSDLQDGLDALNLMLDSWWTERLMCYAMLTYTHTLSGGQGSYTIGPGGDINGQRPVMFQDGYIRLTNVDYPLNFVDQVSYDLLTPKNAPGVPRRAFYNPQYPLGIITFWPIPDQGYTAFLNSYHQVREFASTTDQINLPPGYAKALIYNLAIELAPDYSADIPTELANGARKSRSNLRRINAPQLIMGMDSALLSKNGRYDIQSDGYL